MAGAEAGHMHVNDPGLRSGPPRIFALLEVDENGFSSPHLHDKLDPL